ncbi:MAG: tyrosine-type recombinase/integrase [Pseudonocardiaceae bacterium]|nr:tyrosine-type recombinase/integrase [Pseudonocardiaceae bacterium]
MPDGSPARRIGRGQAADPEGLDLHSLRRSYAAHLLEDSWDPMFVQHQMGHEHASTTGIYQFASTAHVCKARATAAIRRGSHSHAEYDGLIRSGASNRYARHGGTLRCGSHPSPPLSLIK